MAHLHGQLNCWSLRCSWVIACRRCSNYIFILNLIHGFNRLGKDNCKTRRETFKFWDLVPLILEIYIWRYSQTIFLQNNCVSRDPQIFAYIIIYHKPTLLVGKVKSVVLLIESVVLGYGLAQTHTMQSQSRGRNHNPDSKVHGANMMPAWILSAPDGPHVGPMNLAIREVPVSHACIYHCPFDIMMTSSNGNIFRVTGHLCGEFTGPRWIPHTKASDAELWCFLWSASA